MINADISFYFYKQRKIFRCIRKIKQVCFIFVQLYLIHTTRLVHAITPMEENKSFLEKVQMGEKMWTSLHDEGSESLFTSWR